MINARSPQALVATIALSALLLSAAAELQAVRERDFPPKEETDAAMYVQSGTAVRRMSGAYTALAADLYWISYSHDRSLFDLAKTDQINPWWQFYQGSNMPAVLFDNPLIAMRATGHKTMQMSSHYTRVGMEKVRDAFKRLA